MPKSEKPELASVDRVVREYEISKRGERVGVDFGVYSYDTIYDCSCGWSHRHVASTGQYWQKGTTEEQTELALLKHRLDHLEGKILAPEPSPEQSSPEL